MVIDFSMHALMIWLRKKVVIFVVGKVSLFVIVCAVLTHVEVWHSAQQIETPRPLCPPPPPSVNDMCIRWLLTHFFYSLLGLLK